MTEAQRRQLFITLGVAAVLVISIWVIVWFFTLATLTITTNDAANTISLRKLSGTQKDNVSIKQDGKRADIRLGAGTYIVTVTNLDQTSNQVVKLAVGEHKDVTINLSGSMKYLYNEPVTSLGAGSIAASKDLLRFINRNTANNRLYTINNQGQALILDKYTRYLTVSWADPSFGIGYGVDNRTNKYIYREIQDGFATTITPPFKTTATSGLGVAPDKTWYISDGHTVYRGNADGSFTVVYKSSDNIGIKAVSNKALLLSQIPPDSPRQGSLVILYRNGDKYQVSGEAYEAAWSPSGDKLVTSGDTSELFDGKFNKIGVLPSGNFISPVWLDDNTLLYGVSNNIIRYDLNTGRATTFISFDDTVGRPSQIVTSIDGDYVYVSIQRGGNRPTIAYRLDRVPLHNQPFDSSLLQKVSLLVPNTIGDCDLDFVNFNVFSIVMKSESAGTNCVPAVKKYLAGYDINTTNMLFRQL